jgi:hypothetical protein
VYVHRPSDDLRGPLFVVTANASASKQIGLGGVVRVQVQMGEVI